MNKRRNVVTTQQENNDTMKELRKSRKDTTQTTKEIMKDMKRTSEETNYKTADSYYYSNRLFLSLLIDHDASLQIIFVSKEVICPTRDKFLPDTKPAWSDKACFSITCLRQLVL